MDYTQKFTLELERSLILRTRSQWANRLRHTLAGRTLADERMGGKGGERGGEWLLGETFSRLLLCYI